LAVRADLQRSQQAVQSYPSATLRPARCVPIAPSGRSPKFHQHRQNRQPGWLESPAMSLGQSS